MKRPAALPCITLIRHTEYDEQSGALTQHGRDTVGDIALHLTGVPQTLKFMRGQTNLLRLTDQLPPPVDAIIYSDAQRTAATASILKELLESDRKSRHLRHPEIADLGAADWLRERFYPEHYETVSCYSLEHPINYDDFLATDNALRTIAKSGISHLAVVTHAPTLRALSLAMLGKRVGPQGSVGSDEMFCIAEHNLRSEKKKFGMTLSLRAASWPQFMGQAAVTGGLFVPGEGSKPITPQEPGPEPRKAVIANIPDLLLRRIADERRLKTK